MRQYIKVEYIFIFLTIIWPAFGGRFAVDEAGRLTDILMLASWAVLLSKQSFLKTFRSPVATSMGLWMLYVLIQFTVLHSPSLNKDIFVHYFSLLKVFTIMMIVQRDINEGNFIRMLNLLAVSYAIYSVFAFLFIGMTTITFENREDIIYANDPNDISFAACMCWYLLVIKYYIKKYPLHFLVAASLLTAYLIMRLGCRTAFIEMFMIAFALGLIALKRTKFKLVYVVAAITVAVLFLANLDTFFESTMMGQRMSETNEQIELNSGTILDYFGDRGPFYYFGFMEFLNSPIWGIGLKNFGANNVYNEFSCHSEYMVNLAETGIVGAVLFLTFIVCLIVCMRKVKQDILPFDRILLWQCVLIPLMIALFFWTYDRSYIFVMYGMVGGFYLRSISAKRYIILTEN